MFYLNSTLNFGILLVFVFQLEVCYKVGRLLTGLTAQQKGTTARWYSNKTSLNNSLFLISMKLIQKILKNVPRNLTPSPGLSEFRILMFS